MNSRALVNLVTEVASDFWEQKILKVTKIHTEAVNELLNIMPLTMSEKDYYRDIYLKKVKEKFQDELEKKKK